MKIIIIKITSAAKQNEHVINTIHNIPSAIQINSTTDRKGQCDEQLGNRAEPGEGQKGRGINRDTWKVYSRRTKIPSHELSDILLYPNTHVTCERE